MPRKELEFFAQQLLELIPTTVVRVDRPAKSVLHPTMKPVALIESLLRNSALEGQSVLDPFGGSGSTLIAAEKLGMSARVLELDPKYVDVIVRRWEAFTGKIAKHAKTGETFAACSVARLPPTPTKRPSKERTGEAAA